MSILNDLSSKNYLNNLESKVNIKNRLDFKNKNFEHEHKEYIPFKSTYSNNYINNNPKYNNPKYNNPKYNNPKYNTDINLKKNKLCQNVYISNDGKIVDDCKFGSRCNFAHNFNELNINPNECHFNKKCKNIIYCNNYFHNKKIGLSCNRIHYDETKLNYCYRMGEYPDFFNKYHNIKFNKETKYKTVSKPSKSNNYLSVNNINNNKKYKRNNKYNNLNKIIKKIDKNSKLSLSERDELKLLRFCFKEKIHL
jgi:hypothetical protein